MKILLFLFSSALWAQVPVPGSGGGGGGGGGGTPGGSDTQVQFNDSGTFGGDAGFTYNKTTDVASLTGGLAVGSSPPTCTAGTAGVLCLKEGTAPTGEASVGMLYTKTDHLWYTKLNNGAEVQVLTASGTATLTGKTYDTAGSGNAFAINGTAITAVSGTGAVCLASGSACSGGGSSSPFDWTDLPGTERFCPYGIAPVGANTLEADYFWQTSGTVTSASTRCGVTIAGATANTTYYIGESSSNSATSMQINPATEANWQVFGIISGDNNTNSNRFCFYYSTAGGCNDNILVSSGGVGIIYRQGTDTNWQLATCDGVGAACTFVDTGTPYVTNTKFKVYLKATTAGTIKGCADATITGTCNVTEASSATHIKSADMTFRVASIPGSNNSSGLSVWYLGWSFRSGY